MAIFFVIMTSILGGVWYYVWERLVLPIGLSRPWDAIVAALLLTLFLFQIVRFLSMSFRSSRESAFLLLVAYFSLGLMTHLFFATILKDVVWVLPQIVLPDEFARTLVQNEKWACL